MKGGLRDTPSMVLETDAAYAHSLIAESLSVGQVILQCSEASQLAYTLTMCRGHT